MQRAPQDLSGRRLHPSLLLCSVFTRVPPQRSNVLSHIWTSEDVWPDAVCRDFILEWAAELRSRVRVREGAVPSSCPLVSSGVLSCPLMSSPVPVQLRADPQDLHGERLEMKEWKLQLLWMLEGGGENDMSSHKRAIMDWTREIKSRAEVGGQRGRRPIKA